LFILFFSCFLTFVSGISFAQPTPIDFGTHLLGYIATIQNIPTNIPYVFTYATHAPPWPRTVSVAGDFNDWSATTNPMTLNADGVWRTTVMLSPGKHEYKFVLNGTQWITDPLSTPAQLHAYDSGAINSTVDVLSVWQKIPPDGPNIINTSALAYDPQDITQYDPINPHLLRIALAAQQNGLTSVKLIILAPPQSAHQYDLTWGGGEYGSVVWGTVVPINSSEFRYYFALTNGERTFYLAGRNFYTINSSAVANAYTGSMASSVITPEWAQHAIWYEIFPERFRNGDTSNDPAHHVPWTSSWYYPYPAAGEQGDFYSYVYLRFYGGDIQGIQQELPYLRSLGVNSIYLTPIFESPSIHKYDPTDFRHIDDGFGVRDSINKLHSENVLDPNTWQWSASDKLFLNFLATAHAQGFKVIIDVPWGHTGSDFGPFRDVLKNGRNSPFASWFQITSWGPPVQYKSWYGSVNMPMIATDPRLGLAAGYRDYVFAVTRRWMAPDGNPAHGIDGWRLDTAPDVPHNFWIDWRKLVKGINPNALIIGEIWTPAQTWLNKGDQFDGVMNYPLAITATQFFVNAFGNGRQGIGPQALGLQLQQLLDSYPYQADLVQQNLIDSHDTDRFVSRFMNPDLDFNTGDRIQDPHSHYNISKPPALAYLRLEQVAAFQASFVGAPMIWYGDEVGMWSPSDPSDRQPMVWQDLMPYADPQVTVNDSLLQYYRRIDAMRRQLPALETGFYGEFISETSQNIFVFHRDIGVQHVYVLINRGPQAESATIPIFISDRGHELFDYLNPRQMRLIDPQPNDLLGRPILVPAPGATGYRTNSQALTLELGPWSTVILSQDIPGQFDGDFATYIPDKSAP
jgi:cyclomaltodextrinase / maltogenic alpha-amylase / neopullulanase